MNWHLVHSKATPHIEFHQNEADKNIPKGMLHFFFEELRVMVLSHI